jgi:hypothetical protein
MSDTAKTPPPAPPRNGEGSKALLPSPLAGEGPGVRGKAFTLPITFFIFLALWTWKLLSPNPVPEIIRGGIGVDWMFFLAKTLHGGAYAFLTVLGALAFPRHKWWLVAFLALHGVGSEIGQTFVPNRFGSVRDVLIDWGGIVAGVFFLRTVCARR